VRAGLHRADAPASGPPPALSSRSVKKMMIQRPRMPESIHERKKELPLARVEIGGRRQGQDVWARWIDGRVQGDRDLLKVAGLDPSTRFSDPHEFVELVQGLDRGTATAALDVPPRPA
jgi:hypothetical protein